MSKKSRRRRNNSVFHRRTAPGAAPGTLVADPASHKPVVRVFAYDAHDYIEQELHTAADYDRLRELVERYAVTWVNVEGLGDATAVSRLGQVFGLHVLALEDVLNTHQRAKVEPYGQHVFIVARMVIGGERVETDQLAMFLGNRFVVTFQHQLGDCFEPLRDRIRQGHTVVRNSGADYLTYALLDAVVDAYFPALENFDEEIRALEDTILSSPDGELIPQIHEVRNKLLVLRRAIWPLRDALHVLVRDPNPLVHDETRVYLRDCADHTFQIVDLIDTYHELISNLMSLYQSALSNRMNEIMQVLTVIATIFIPLTFIVGVYGMNFKSDSPWAMPELESYWGYPAVWLAMITIAAGLLLFFRRKGWLPHARSQANKPPPDENV